MKFNKNVLISVIIIILFMACVCLAAILFLEKKNSADSQTAVNKAMEYLKQSDSSSEITLIGMNSNKFKLKDLYEFVVETNGTKYSLFITSDGKYLISANSIVDITQPITTTDQTTPQNESTTIEETK